MAGTASRRGPIVGINVTPMVDIVLVLLVIMMVTATYIVAQSFNVELPKTASSDTPSPSPAVVTLEVPSRLRWNDAPVTEAELVGYLRDTARAPDATIVISADRAVAHGAVMHVVDLAKLAGITKFALNVERVE
jgi:biopolymer transport protein ExbD